MLLAIAAAAGYFFENFLVFFLLALAINFAINNYENIDIISPQFLINELKNRNDKLKKKLKI